MCVQNKWHERRILQVPKLKGSGPMFTICLANQKAELGFSVFGSRLSSTTPVSVQADNSGDAKLILIRATSRRELACIGQHIIRDIISI